MEAGNVDDDRHCRVILHFDVDAMYVACERELNPELRGVPVGVCQYNPFGKLQDTSPRDIHRRIMIRNGTIVHQGDANGSLIAVSYEARAEGVKRNDRGLEARLKCPTLSIVQVPVKRGKADLTLYRTASHKIFRILLDSVQNLRSLGQQPNTTREPHPPVQIEVASIDEVYLDVTRLCHYILQKSNLYWEEIISLNATQTTVGGMETMTPAAHVHNALTKDDLRKGSALQIQDYTKTLDHGSWLWWRRPREQWTEAEEMLAVGAWLAARARAAVTNALEGVYTLSGGVSSNKTLAKLASGLKKPNRQTLIHGGNPAALDKLFYPLPLDRIRGLGGKLGVTVCEKLAVTTLGQLAQVPLVTLTKSFSAEMARFLFDIGKGICGEAVTPRTKPKSISCGKTFRGILAIRDSLALKRWTEELCASLEERISNDRDQYHRMPRLLIANIHFHALQSHVSKSCLAPRSLETMSKVFVDLVQKLASSKPHVSIVGLTLAVSSFTDVATGESSIAAAFKRAHVHPETRKSADAANIAASYKLEKLQATSSSFIDQWLKNRGNQNDRETFNRKSVVSRGVSKMPEQLRQVDLMQPYLATHEAVAPQTSAESLITSNSIDTRIWNELPGDIQQSLQKEWETPSRQRLSIPKKRSRSFVKKRKSVQAFTSPHGMIDPAVWNELPAEIQSSLLRELETQAKKSRAGITSFFDRDTRSSSEAGT